MYEVYDDEYPLVLRRKDIRREKFRKEKQRELKEKWDAEQQRLQKKLQARIRNRNSDEESQQSITEQGT
jgi:hypothetical protein